MKTQEIAILDFGLGLDDEIGYEGMLTDIDVVCDGCNIYQCHCEIANPK